MKIRAILFIVIATAGPSGAAPGRTPAALVQRDRQGEAWDEIGTRNLQLAQNPNDRIAWFGRGRSYLELGDFEQAVKELTRSLELGHRQHVSEPDSTYLRGWALAKQGDRVGARANFRGVTPLDRINGEAVPTLSLEELGQGAAAKRRLHDCGPDVREWRGWLLESVGELRRAEAELTVAWRLDPGDRKLLSERAHVRLALADYADARADYAAARDWPGAAWADYLGGSTRLALQDCARSKRATAPRWHTRALCLLASGRSVAAVADAERAAADQPRNPFYQDELAYVLTRAGRAEAAAAASEKANQIRHQALSGP